MKHQFTEEEICAIGQLTQMRSNSKAFLGAKRHLLTGERKSDVARLMGVKKATIQNAVKKIEDSYCVINRVFLSKK